MPRTLISRSKCSVSGAWAGWPWPVAGPGPRGSREGPSLLMVSYRLRQVGIVDRQQRPCFQLAEKIGEPEAAESERRHEVEPVEAAVVVREGRLHLPDQLHPAHDQHQHGDDDEPPGVALE